MLGIIVDTSVWVEFLRGVRNFQTTAVERLVRSGPATICGVVLNELLAGVPSQRERELLQDALAGLNYIEVAKSTRLRAGELAATLHARRHALPLSDLVLAALALEHGCSVFTFDKHFRQIPGLKLYHLE